MRGRREYDRQGKEDREKQEKIKAKVDESKGNDGETMANGQGKRNESWEGRKKTV